LHGLGLIERIERAGGAFFSVRDGLDLTTDTGRLVLRIMLAMAEWQLDRTRAGWEVSVARAVARGVYVASHVPVGYRKLRSGRLRIEPATAPFMAELFERRAQGATLRSLARFLEAHEVRTSYGNAGWGNGTIRNVVANRVYLGEVCWGRYVRERAHEALTDEATWQAAQLPKRTVHARRENPALLSGLVRCASCGHRMRTAPQGGLARVSYVCCRITAAGICPAPAQMSAVPLEICVEDVVLDLLSRRRRAPRAALHQAENGVRDAQAALAQYRDSDRILGVLGDRAYADGLAVRVQRVRDAALELASARTRIAAHELPPASQLEADWPDMDLQARREIIVQVIDCVFVLPGKRNYDERIWVCPVGTEPRGLPRRGERTARMRAWQPRRGWISARYTASRPPRWTHARLERELRAFTAGRTAWPAPPLFLSAGRSRLYRQTQLQGGDRYWAKQLGLPPYRPRSIHWPDKKIRDALTEYLNDKDAWPTASQFGADRQSSLRVAITNSGGVHRWAIEFGMQGTNPRNRGPIPYWTEARIRDHLTRFCQGRTTFPSRRELQQAGLGGLHAALGRHGDARSLIAELGLTSREP
jgi:hypothetical protein